MFGTKMGRIRRMGICLAMLTTLAVADDAVCGQQEIKEAERLFEAGAFEQSFTMVSSQAEAGDAEAQFWAAIHYRMGLGVVQDYEKAVDLFNAAADQGYEGALYGLMQIYQSGLDMRLGQEESMQALQAVQQRAGISASPNGVIQTAGARRYGMIVTGLLQKCSAKLDKANQLLAGRDNDQRHQAVQCLNSAESLLQNLEQSGPPFSRLSRGLQMLLYNTYRTYDIPPLDPGALSRLEQQMRSRIPQGVQ